MGENGPMHNPYGEHADLDRWGQNAAPQHQFRASHETMAPGDYDVECVDAALDMVNGKKIARLGLKLLNAGGRVIEYVYWLTDQRAVNGLLADMAMLGFPAHTWGQGPGKIALSQAIPDALPKLVGLRFHVTKETQKVDAKPAFAGQPAREAATYHKLHFGSRITGAPMPPIKSAPMPTPAQQSAPAYPVSGAETGESYNPDDLPF